MKYTERFKERIVQQMSGPDALSAGALCKEVGIPQTTLSRWLREACIASPFQFPVNNEVTMTMPSRRPQDWSVEEKLQVVLEAASVLEEQLGVFLRGHEGLELSGKVSKETIDFLTQKIRK
ncbi:MAG: helix-turn-helix transcriptional regulator, partial [Desulfobacterales bacterium]|nr:helix-turn-helix transcriptional regulator [Desulfobacterales bacterium]